MSGFAWPIIGWRDGCGEFLLLLNNDTALWPDALATLLAAARALGRPAILSLPQYEWETGELLDRDSQLDPLLNPVPNRNPDRHEVGLVMEACLWIPRRLWAELGGFPEWFGSIGEDLYGCGRARLAGYPYRCWIVRGIGIRWAGVLAGVRWRRGGWRLWDHPHPPATKHVGFGQWQNKSGNSSSAVLGRCLLGWKETGGRGAGATGSLGRAGAGRGGAGGGVRRGLRRLLIPQFADSGKTKAPGLTGGFCLLRQSVIMLCTRQARSCWAMFQEHR